MSKEKLEELKIRIDNIKLIIQIAEQELYLLLEEKDVLETYTPVGFKSKRKNDKGSNPTN